MDAKPCSFPDCRGKGVVLWHVAALRVGPQPRSYSTVRVCRKCSRGGVSAVEAGKMSLAGETGGSLVVEDESGVLLSVCQSWDGKGFGSLTIGNVDARKL